jgi:replicative DNA helicase
MQKFQDLALERSLIGCVMNNGKDAFIECSAVALDSSDFVNPVNRIVYSCFKAIDEDDRSDQFDEEMIKLKAKELGFSNDISEKKNAEYLSLLDRVQTKIENVQELAYQIKKLSIFRQIKRRCQGAVNYIDSIDGSQQIAEVLGKLDSEILDPSSLLLTEKTAEKLGEGITEYIDQILGLEEISQVGVSTGFKIWDNCVGGGLRKGTVSIISARSKVGKSFLAMNIARNIAHQGTPVLYLDTELTQDYQQSRMICIEASYPIKSWETRKFKRNQQEVDKIKQAGNVVQDLPLYYESVAGKEYSEMMVIIRRWLAKHVGYGPDGKANDCVIVFDYFKLLNGKSLGNNSPEYILLGLALTDFSNFAIKHGVPILGFTQSNRSGIDQEDSSIVSGSDRILWLCSSLSIFKNKDENDIAAGCNFDYGNKKLIVVDCRHGPGHSPMDYINIKASLRPGVNDEEGTGRITEGLTFASLQDTGEISDGS